MPVLSFWTTGLERKQIKMIQFVLTRQVSRPLSISSAQIPTPRYHLSISMARTEPHTRDEDYLTPSTVSGWLQRHDCLRCSRWRPVPWLHDSQPEGSEVRSSRKNIFRTSFGIFFFNFFLEMTSNALFARRPAWRKLELGQSLVNEYIFFPNNFHDILFITQIYLHLFTPNVLQDYICALLHILRAAEDTVGRGKAGHRAHDIFTLTRGYSEAHRI